MKRYLFIALGLLATIANAATTVPVQLLNPAGSSSGQAVVSTGPSTAPGWGVVATAGANSNITSLSGLTTPLSVPQGGSGLASLAQYNVLAGNGTGTISAIAPSTSGFVLTSNGGSAFPTFQALPSGRLIAVQRFTSSGTYTPTSGATSAIIYCAGGGGGGGGGAATNSAQNSVAGPGSSGAWAVVRVTSLSSQTVTIGAGGPGGVAGANAGTAGGQTSVGTWAVCPGGGGGSAGAATAFANTTLVGNPGSVSSAPTSTATLLYGSIGGSGTYAQLAYNGTALVSGIGGSNPFGSGAVGSAVNGFGYGSGGTGALVGISSAAVAGGSGAGGIVLIFEYN
jgi:hypothetical protein